MKDSRLVRLVTTMLLIAASVSGLAFYDHGASIDVTLLPPGNLGEADLGSHALEYEVLRLQDGEGTTIATGELDTSSGEPTFSMSAADLASGEEIDLIALLWARPRTGDAHASIASVANEIFPYAGEPLKLSMQFTDIRRMGDDTPVDDPPTAEDAPLSASGLLAPDLFVPEPEAHAPAQPSSVEVVEVKEGPPNSDVVAASLLRSDPYDLHSNPLYHYVRMRNCDPYDPVYTVEHCEINYAGPGGGVNPAGGPPQETGFWLLATRDIPGVFALRGYSTRIHGDDSTFSFESDYSQKWDIGVRVKAGPFEVGGGKVVFTGQSGTDTWPTRYDCIERSENHSCNWDARGTAGTLWEASRDTWVWERWLYRSCSTGPSTCYDTYEERVFLDSFDGGTEWMEDKNGNAAVFSGGYMAKPSQVRQGAFGRWAQYAAGAIRRVTRQSGSETYWGPAAHMEAGNSAWGVVTWSANFAEQNVTEVSTKHAFRNDKPYWGKSLVYDRGQRRREYWTCEWSRGWTGGSCWTAP